MGRPRAFDWDKALRLHDAGLSYAEIGRLLGVSATSVMRACKPDYRERDYRSRDERIAARRRPCANGCGTLVWGHTNTTGYCRPCWNVAKLRPIPHGTESKYSSGCRCHRCRAAATCARRLRRQAAA